MELKRAALYIRVSTDEQVRDGYSVDAQKEHLKHFAENKGYKIVGIYTDEGISARKKYTRRKSFMELIHNVKLGKIDIILFIKLDRWFRNVADYYKIQEILDRYNVGWIATTENYDTTTANGRLYVNIRLAVAQDESDRTSERIKFVFAKKITDGEAINGHPPFGYKIKNKKLIIDDTKSEIVRMSFKLYKKYRSINKTFFEINKMFDNHFSYKTFYRILKLNLDIYSGKYRNNDNFSEPYITKEEYKQIKEIANETSIRHRSNKHVYIFSGLLQCAHCGYAITGFGSSKSKKGNKAYFNYSCCGKFNLKCDKLKSISEKKLELLVLNKIQEEVKKYIVGYKINEKKAKTLTINITSINRKLERLKDLYLNELIEIEDYKKEYNLLQEQIKNYEKEQNEFIKEKDISKFNKFLSDDFLEVYQSLDLLSKRELWYNFIKKIIIKNKQVYQIIFK